MKKVLLLITVLLIAASVVAQKPLPSDDFKIPVNPVTGKKFTYSELAAATGDLKALVDQQRERLAPALKRIKSLVKKDARRKSQSQDFQTQAADCQAGADAYYDGCMIASWDEWYCFVVTELWLRYCYGQQ